MVLLLSALALLPSCRRDEVQTLSARLDRVIADKPVYDAQKERRIGELRLLLGVSGLSQEQEYEINTRLYREFKKYKLDSAIRYVERNVELAHALDNDRYAALSELRLARLYSSTGRCIEAKRILESVDRASLPRDVLHAYYRAYNQFYQHYVALSGQRKYYHEMNLYGDSMILVGDPRSVRYKLSIASRISSREQPDSVESYLLGLFSEIAPDDPHHAEIAHQLGSFYWRQNNEKQSKKYYMLSAITDAQLSIKENASFQSLATVYYNSGDLSQAFKYTQAAIEDAIFSNVQFRTAQMSELYSIISVSHQAKEVNTKHKLQRYLALISILSAVLVLLFIYLCQQLRKQYRTRTELSLTNGKLAQLNDELAEKNDQLSDSNAVKVQYIARFFDLCSMYIDKMDDYRKGLKKLAQDRQYDELYRQLKSTSMLETEQEELYKNFDAIFLNLYPSFVEDFNALLTEDERIVLRSGDLLNKELRIYALLRLGISDSVKIASFLRCSLSTVYNYRTKVRNKAAVSREEFEKKVMKIGAIHKSDG